MYDCVYVTYAFVKLSDEPLVIIYLSCRPGDTTLEGLGTWLNLPQPRWPLKDLG